MKSFSEVGIFSGQTHEDNIVPFAFCALVGQYRSLVATIHADLRQEDVDNIQQRLVAREYVIVLLDGAQNHWEKSCVEQIPYLWGVITSEGILRPHSAYDDAVLWLEYAL